MNNGAFGENFPYSNFHNLNMDWIIKIAKDFLDQYTHIQEVIANGEQSLQDLTASGLEQLQEKADALKDLLQQWYDTHSADIANQLADALEDLNEWYTTHQNYLDNTLQANITAFDTHANQKAIETIASIPSDYTTLSNSVTDNLNKLMAQLDIVNKMINYNQANISNMKMHLGYHDGTGVWTNSSSFCSTRFFLNLPENFIGRVSSQSGVTVYMGEYNAQTHQRIRQVFTSGTTPVYMDQLRSDCLYAFYVQSTTPFTNPPTTGFTFELLGSNINTVQIMDLTKIIGNMVSLGYSTLPENPEIGFINGDDGKWMIDPSSRHLSFRSFLRVPDECTISAYIANTSISAYIKEFEFDGTTFTRTNQWTTGNRTTINHTKANKYYSIDYYRADAWTTIPVRGVWDVTITPMANLNNTITYEYESNGTLRLAGTKCKYTLKRITDASSNLDTWRLYKGELKINGEWDTLWENSDAEGVVNIDNDSDFLGGYHGNEVLSSFSILIDNVALDTTASTSGYCTSVMLYQTSTIYRLDQTTEAFTRYKRIRIVGNNYDVQQSWHSLINCTITRGVFCLLQAMKPNMLGWNTDINSRWLSTYVASGVLDRKTRIGNFYFNDNKMLSLIAEVGYDNEYYRPYMQNFTNQNRLKFYFDMFNGKTISPGDVLETKFAVKVDQDF